MKKEASLNKAWTLCLGAGAVCPLIVALWGIMIMTGESEPEWLGLVLGALMLFIGSLGIIAVVLSYIEQTHGPNTVVSTKQPQPPPPQKPYIRKPSNLSPADAAIYERTLESYLANKNRTYT